VALNILFALHAQIENTRAVPAFAHLPQKKKRAGNLSKWTQKGRNQ
jgi:hypothetical protein